MAYDTIVAAFYLSERVIQDMYPELKLLISCCPGNVDAVSKVPTVEKERSAAGRLRVCRGGPEQEL